MSIQDNTTDNNTTARPVDTRVAVCSTCGSSDYTDAPISGSLRLNRYCNNCKKPDCNMGYFDPSESSADAEAPTEPAKKPASPVATGTATKSLPIEHIDRSRTQVRAELNQETVKEYALAMVELKERKASGETIDARDEFPPPIVFLVDGETYHLVDGYHRVAAAEEIHETDIACDVRTGSLRDAIAYALSANAKHGLKMSNEDKWRVVTLALADPVWRQWSSSRLARLCGVSHTFVDKVRNKELAAPGCNGCNLTDASQANPAAEVATVATSKPEKQVRIGDDNKKYPLKPRTPNPPAPVSTEPSDSDDEPPAKAIKSGTEIGVPIPVIRQALSAYGALIRELCKLHNHPQSKITAYDLGCEDELDVIQAAIMSVNGPVEVVDGQWVPKGDDPDGLIADTIAAIEHTKMLVLKKVTAA